MDGVVSTGASLWKATKASRGGDFAARPIVKQTNATMSGARMQSSETSASGITILSSEFEQQPGEKGIFDASRRLADKVGTVSSDVLAKNLQSFCEEIGEAFDEVSTV